MGETKRAEPASHKAAPKNAKAAIGKSKMAKQVEEDSEYEYEDVSLDEPEGPVAQSDPYLLPVEESADADSAKKTVATKKNKKVENSAPAEKKASAPAEKKPVKSAPGRRHVSSWNH